MASRNQRKNKRNNNKRNNDDNARNQSHTGPATGAPRGTVAGRAPRSSSETKSSLRTTELVAYAVTVLAIIMTALAVDDDGQGGADPFGYEPALRYITYLTIGYLVARGLAKAGSWQTDVRGSSDEQAGGHDGTHDGTQGAGTRTEPDRDLVDEDTAVTSPGPRQDRLTTDGPTGHVSAVDTSDVGDDHEARLEASTGEKASASRGPS